MQGAFSLLAPVALLLGHPGSPKNPIMVYASQSSPFFRVSKTRAILWYHGDVRTRSQSHTRVLFHFRRPPSCLPGSIQVPILVCVAVASTFPSLYGQGYTLISWRCLGEVSIPWTRSCWLLALLSRSSPFREAGRLQESQTCPAQSSLFFPVYSTRAIRW